MSDDLDDLQIRRLRLKEAAKTPRTKQEIEKALLPYKSKIHLIIDDKEATLTREFEAMVTDPDNNKVQHRKEVTLTVSGNLFRPIEDFVYDAKWLLAQTGSIRDAQRGSIHKRA